MKRSWIITLAIGIPLVILGIIVFGRAGGQTTISDPATETRQVPGEQRKAILDSMRKHNKDLSKQDIERMRKSIGGK